MRGLPRNVIDLSTAQNRHAMMRAYLPVCTALFSLLILSACVPEERLQPTRLAALKIVPAGEPNAGQLVQSKMSERVPHNFPIRPATDGSLVYVSDPARLVVRVFSLGGDLEKLIGDPNARAPEDVKHIKVAGGVPGWVVADGDNIYVQFRPAGQDPRKATPGPVAGAEPNISSKNTPPENRLTVYTFDTKDRVPAPSLIYHITNNQVRAVLGVDGVGAAPFTRIDRMDAASDNRLLVTHQLGDKVVLSVYEDGKMIRRYEPNPGTEEERRNYTVRVDDMMACADATAVMLSATFLKKDTFAPEARRLYRIDAPGAEPKMIYEFRDLRQYFGACRADGGFLLLEAERDGSSLSLNVYSNEGNQTVSRKMVFPGLRSSWREPYIALDEKIYSSRLNEGRLELYEWK